MIEGNFNPEIKKESEEFFVTKSRFSDKLFWVKPDSGEIIQVRNLNSKIARKIGDEVTSNGRLFKPKGTKGTIKGFRDDSCYIKVEWEDGTVSFMKDKDLTQAPRIEEQENELLKKQWSEIFDLTYDIALKQGNKKVAEEIARFKNIGEGKDVDMKELSRTARACSRFIEKYQKSLENPNKSPKKMVKPRFFEG